MASRSRRCHPLLVRAKLRPPQLPPHYVRRPRLFGLVDAAIAAPLTLLVAPAGSGKTSLLAGWAAESAFPTAWLALDEGDSGPAHLWRASSLSRGTVFRLR